ncbi:MAG: phospho-sugar mutase, partial [Propionibacteriaceae bacterium]|nr:phospho-sugar mutase [Propionibacteriaceae bacterium]
MSLMDEVAAWILADPDEDCRQELRALADQAATDPAAQAELADRFAATLQFGTAGLRGQMAAGPNRMNRAVVMRAAKGLIDYLMSEVDTPVVVIGNDARYHSRQFALDTAAIVTAAGGRALLLPTQWPTPLLAYSVRHLNADAGVMVTASHNPALDNGYKVYLGGRMVTDPECGAQIVPPYDTEIAARIEAAPPANQIAQAEGWTDLGDEIMESYVAAVVGDAEAGLTSDTVTAATTRSSVGRSSVGHPTGSTTTAPVVAPPAIRIVHTAMHGVGSAPALAILRRAGFTDIHSVVEQEKPDPAFPTVSFPNPEEPGAIDLALALARKVDPDVVIANDPDADRCAVATKDPRSGWRMLHGDELGAILGEAVAARIETDRDADQGCLNGVADERPLNRPGPTVGREGGSSSDERLADCSGLIVGREDVPSSDEPSSGPLLVNSIVSSRQLAVIAQSHGVASAHTLTGFKWMGRVPGMAYAYEEAIGYCVRPDLVHDKD